MPLHMACAGLPAISVNAPSGAVCVVDGALRTNCQGAGSVRCIDGPTGLLETYHRDEHRTRRPLRQKRREKRHDLYVCRWSCEAASPYPGLISHEFTFGQQEPLSLRQVVKSFHSISLDRPHGFCGDRWGAHGADLLASALTATSTPLLRNFSPRSAANPGFPFPSFPLRFPSLDRPSTNTAPPSQSQPQKEVQQFSAKSKGAFSRSIQVFSKSKDDSELTNDRPLPLPMPYPDSKPLGAEAVQEMLSCDPDVANCKTVVYQWTDKCRRCMGTGSVSFRRKRKHDVEVTCVACTGIGYVQRFTTRDNIPVMEDIDKS